MDCSRIWWIIDHALCLHASPLLPVCHGEGDPRGNRRSWCVFCLYAPPSCVKTCRLLLVLFSSIRSMCRWSIWPVWSSQLWAEVACSQGHSTLTSLLEMLWVLKSAPCVQDSAFSSTQLPLNPNMKRSEKTFSADHQSLHCSLLCSPDVLMGSIYEWLSALLSQQCYLSLLWACRKQESPLLRIETLDSSQISPKYWPCAQLFVTTL